MNILAAGLGTLGTCLGIVAVVCGVWCWLDNRGL